MCVGHVRSCLDLLGRSLGATIGNVIRNGEGKEKGFLGNGGDITPERVDFEISKVAPIQGDASSQRVEEPWNERYEGAFTCPGAPYQGDGLPGFGGEGDI